MGNVTSLTRSGERDNNHYGTIDILDYSYDGNQVVKVSDKESGPHFKGAFHFVDGADEDIEYTYDANGNMTQDLNKGIQSIEYNVLNLPVAVNFKLRDDQTGLEEKKSIEYFYDSDGGKRAVLYTDGETSTDDNPLCYSYTDNRTFEDGELGQILFNGGYVTFKDGKPQYHFYLQDHLGNNRIVADSRGNIEQINTYYPFGALIQDGFSEDITSTQRYKYNGKELDRMFGIDSYDYGARMYDPCMIRWRSLDPLCEKYYSISPYAYCANDPINAIDKGGYFILPSILEKINKRGHAVPIEYMSYIKYITAMNKFGETSYGRNFLAKFLPTGMSQYGVSGTGEFEDVGLVIREYNMERYYDYMGNNNGRFELEEHNGTLHFILNLDCRGMDSKELLETITHELTLHGYKVGNVINSYKEGGIDAAEKEFYSNSTNDEHQDRFKADSKKGGAYFNKTKDEIIESDNSYSEIFRKRNNEQKK